MKSKWTDGFGCLSAALIGTLVACTDEAVGPNRAPVAVAGPDKSAMVGSRVELDGKGSYDPDNDPLTFQWQLLSSASASSATLEASGPTATLTLNQIGVYLVGLSVSDGQLSSVDDVVRVTAIKRCTNDSECNDNNICTTDKCVNGTCSLSPNDNLSCNDNDACTENDHCSSGVCQGTTVSCEDNISCTDDSCDKTTGCKHTNNTLPCDDQKFCTQNDVCAAGICLGTGTPCPDKKCDEGQQKCVDCQSKDDCNDNIACTSDNCNDGVCEHTNDNAACNDQSFCTGEMCGPGSSGADPGTGCVHKANPCSTQKCRESPLPHCVDCLENADCVDAYSCTEDICSQSTNTCSNTPNNTNCNDGLFCNGNEQCNPGHANRDERGCISGTNPCLNPTMCNSCNESADNCHDPDTTSCNDGDLCTENDRCDGQGGCRGTRKNCDDNHDCTDDSCDSASGQCINTINSSSCLINGFCYSDGGFDPNNFCQVCNSNQSQTTWSNRQNGSYCDASQVQLITCQDGMISTMDCQFGCKEFPSPHCAVFAPSNIPDPDWLCENSADLTIVSPVTINTNDTVIPGVGGIMFHTVAQTNGPTIKVFSFNSIAISAPVTVVGDQALLLIACHDVTINGIITACASGTGHGPGGWDGGASESDGLGYSRGYGLGSVGESAGSRRQPGGGGGASGGIGGNGGEVGGLAGGLGGQAYQTDAMTPLLGGSGGGGGADHDGWGGGGKGGGGGGVVEIVAGGTITIENGYGINVCGAGASASDVGTNTGGGGGGAGGGILIEGVNVNLLGTLAANGGGGSGGSCRSAATAPGGGDDGLFGDTAANGGAPSGNGAGRGGNGAAGNAAEGAAGGNGSTGCGAGGGGGGAGRIRINTRSGTVDTSSAVLSPNQTSGLFTNGTILLQ